MCCSAVVKLSRRVRCSYWLISYNHCCIELLVPALGCPPPPNFFGTRTAVQETPTLNGVDQSIRPKLFLLIGKYLLQAWTIRNWTESQLISPFPIAALINNAQLCAVKYSIFSLYCSDNDVLLFYSTKSDSSIRLVTTGKTNPVFVFDQLLSGRYQSANARVHIWSDCFRPLCVRTLNSRLFIQW